MTRKQESRDYFEEKKVGKPMERVDVNRHKSICKAQEELANGGSLQFFIKQISFKIKTKITQISFQVYRKIPQAMWANF